MKLASLGYIQRDGHTLMLHRIKKENDIHAGKWNGLGGKFEPGETPEECIIREIREESGLVVRNPILRGIITFPNFANNEDWYAFVFVVSEFEGQMVDDSAEGYLKWIPDSELLDLNLWEGDKIFIHWLARSDCFSGKFVYKNKQLVEHNVVFYP